MAIYTGYQNSKKEPLYVNGDTRQTLQQVKFLNTHNMFTGTLSGAIISRSKFIGNGGFEMSMVDFEKLVRTANDLSITYMPLSSTLSDIQNTAGFVTEKIDGMSINGSVIELSSHNFQSGVTNVITADMNQLSDTFGGKITIDGVRVDNFGIHHIDRTDYESQAMDGTLISTDMYIVSSDNSDMYGERIMNVGNPISAYDAVNLQYLTNMLSSLSSQIMENIKTVSIQEI